MKKIVCQNSSAAIAIYSLCVSGAGGIQICKYRQIVSLAVFGLDSNEVRVLQTTVQNRYATDRPRIRPVPNEMFIADARFHARTHARTNVQSSHIDNSVRWYGTRVQ